MTENVEEWERLVLWFVRLGVAEIGNDQEAAESARRQLEHMGVTIDHLNTWWSEYPMVWLAKFKREFGAGDLRAAAKAQGHLARLGLKVRLLPPTFRRALARLGLDVRVLPGKETK